MNCLECTHKSCKTSSRDCNGNRPELLTSYQNETVKTCYTNADDLVSGGKAGTLSRLQEIALFSRAQGYRAIGIAYCYSMEELAARTAAYLRSEGLSVHSYRCTINGIKECQVDPKLGQGVSCNPLGQAEAINKEQVDFVVEMGLCLGHDLLFHQHLKKPFTVFIVKDRLYAHDPKQFLAEVS